MAPSPEMGKLGVGSEKEDHNAFEIAIKLPKMCPVNSYSMKGNAKGQAFKETHANTKGGARENSYLLNSCSLSTEPVPGIQRADVTKLLHIIQQLCCLLMVN